MSLPPPVRGCRVYNECLFSRAELVCQGPHFHDRAGGHWGSWISGFCPINTIKHGTECFFSHFYERLSLRCPYRFSLGRAVREVNQNKNSDVSWASISKVASCFVLPAAMWWMMSGYLCPPRRSHRAGAICAELCLCVLWWRMSSTAWHFQNGNLFFATTGAWFRSASFFLMIF